MATFIAEYEFFQIDFSKDYTLVDWKIDMKNLLKKTGLEGSKVVFLVNENQLKDETILEDINSILISGDISNLFDADEKLSIVEKVNKSKIN